MKIYTIGYGGRGPEEFMELLKQKGIRIVVDVRLRPEYSSMGIYKKAKSANQGIEGLLIAANIQYTSVIELGNVYLGYDDWQEKYQNLLDKAGELLIGRLKEIPVPFCLMCAEKKAMNCHRKLIADYLIKNGYEVEHIE